MQNYGYIIVSVTEMVVTTLVFLFLGRWLDTAFHKDGVFIAVGAILGFIIGFVRFVVRLKKLMDDGTP